MKPLNFFTIVNVKKPQYLISEGDKLELLLPLESTALPNNNEVFTLFLSPVDAAIRAELLNQSNTNNQYEVMSFENTRQSLRRLTSTEIPETIAASVGIGGSQKK